MNFDLLPVKFLQFLANLGSIRLCHSKFLLNTTHVHFVLPFCGRSYVFPWDEGFLLNVARFLNQANTEDILVVKALASLSKAV